MTNSAKSTSTHPSSVILSPTFLPAIGGGGPTKMEAALPSAGFLDPSFFGRPATLDLVAAVCCWSDSEDGFSQSSASLPASTMSFERKSLISLTLRTFISSRAIGLASFLGGSFEAALTRCTLQISPLPPIIVFFTATLKKLTYSIWFCFWRPKSTMVTFPCLMAYKAASWSLAASCWQLYCQSEVGAVWALARRKCFIANYTLSQPAGPRYAGGSEIWYLGSPTAGSRATIKSKMLDCKTLYKHNIAPGWRRAHLSARWLATSTHRSSASSRTARTLSRTPRPTTWMRWVDYMRLWFVAGDVRGLPGWWQRLWRTCRRWEVLRPWEGNFCQSTFGIDRFDTFWVVGLVNNLGAKLNPVF